MNPGRVVALALGAVVLLAACDASVPPASPSATPDAFADRPAVTIDGTWTARNGQWTFTGSVDPAGAPTDVVLDIGPGPQTLRQFDSHLAVATQVTAAQPLTITTAQIPNIPQICVRFTATNSAGSSLTTPLCFPHDLPSFVPPTAPSVRIDDVQPGTNGQWTISAYVDPKGAATDVILEVGTGPEGAPTFTSRVPMTSGMTDPATLQVSTAVPAASQVCVRVNATNSQGTSTAATRCFSPAAPS